MKRVPRALGLLFLLLSMGTFAKAEDPINPTDPITPPGEIQPSNKIEFDKQSPNSPVVGKLTAAGTVTEAMGWKCTKVSVVVTDAATGKELDKATGAPGAGGAWSYSNTGFTTKTNIKLTATATFTKGKMEETKSVEGLKTIR